MGGCVKSKYPKATWYLISLAMTMDSMHLKTFDNFFVKCFYIFLPFTYALTINLGFPFKISEISILVIIIFLLLRSRVKVPNYNLTIFQTLALFFVVCSFTTLINLFWPYSYPLREYESRFGFRFDSILKLCYLLFSFIAFVIAIETCKLNPIKYIKYFLAGAMIASLYSWYLFLSGLLGVKEYLLPGIENPQYIGVSFGIFIRSGTFVEGNHMGLFLFLAVVLSFYLKKKWLGLFFVLSLIPTFSSIALVAASLFLISYYFKNYYNRRNVHRLIFFVLFVIVTFSSLLGNEDFRVMVVSKFVSDKAKPLSNVGEISRMDRLNSAEVALRIGLENPIFGVGLSNYGMHYDEFNTDSRFVFEGAKRIPNNVYAEIFSETGVFGLLLFIYLLYLFYRRTRSDQTGSLRYGLIGFLIYCLAFPTFTILYIWVFFGFIASTQHDKK